MSAHRSPRSCSWQFILAFPIIVFVVLLLVLALFFPESSHAQMAFLADPVPHSSWLGSGIS